MIFSLKVPDPSEQILAQTSYNEAISLPPQLVMAGVFINPKTDFAFKKIFGSQESKDILIGFLNAIVYEGQPTIQDLQIIDPYQAPRLKGNKTSYLDVKATLTDGTMVVIEMQVLSVIGFEKRVLYNAAKAFSIQLEVGEDYAQLNSVIALTITDFEMFPGSDRIVSRYRFKERDDLTDYSDDLELIFVELPKFTKELDGLTDELDKWLYFLKTADRLETVPSTMEEVPEINHAFEIAKQSLLSKDELEIFEKQQMFIHDNHNALLKAEQDGQQKGLQQGLQQGKREIAQSLLGVLEPEIIAQSTELSLSEIQQLQSEQRP
jgi:predicted transposase/invertase (TIGR01784 family)